jgi:flagellar hook assembly protein FlgD
MPSGFVLDQNYPNPFNPSTTIGYRLAEAGLVRLKVYDVLGREVATLADHVVPAGDYTGTWDGRNGSGQQVATGVYHYRLEVAYPSGVKHRANRKMVLIR